MDAIKRSFEREHQPRSIILKWIGIILAVVSLGSIYFFFYEWFFVNHYWQNRFKLYNYLRNGEGELSYGGTAPTWDQIHVYLYKLKGRSYRICEFRGGEAITLDSMGSDGFRADLIGVYAFSPLMFHMNKHISKLMHQRVSEKMMPELHGRSNPLGTIQNPVF